MKKLVYFAVAALVFAACAKELAPEQIEDTTVVESQDTPMVKISLTATLGEDITKAEISMTTGACSWKKDDAIAVHTTNGAIATLYAEEDGTTVKFTGDIAAGDSVPADAIAYYPAIIAVEGDATKVNLPASYASAADAAKGFLLRGVVSGENVTFKHIGSILKLTINDIPDNVTSLVVTGNSQSLSGELSVDTSVADAPKCSIASGAATVTVTTAAADRSPASVFYIPMPVGTLSSGATVTIKAGNDDVYSKSFTSNKTLARASVLKMKAFAPEGTGSEWYVAGGFNSWNTTATQMTAVLGHDNWVVARNVDTTPVSGQDAGFKFVNSGTWKGGSTPGLHTQYDTDNDNNIVPANGKYDIYFNTSNNKFFYANAGEPWIYKTVYMMSDMVLSDGTYYLHVWSHSGPGFETTWPGIEMSGTETISGIKYYKFSVAICDGDFTSGTYDCIFHNNYSDKTNSGARQYDFRDGALIVNNTDDAYYLSFSGNKYNKAVAEGNSHATYGDNTSNPMTQFTDPAKPAGDSRWGSYIGGSLKYMHWDDSPVLVVNDIEVGPTTGVRFCFEWDGGHFYGLSSAGNVSANTYFDVVHSGSAQEFTVPSLDGTYICDLYLDIINNKAKVVAKYKTEVTLYFGLTDREMSKVNFYTFGAWYNHGWPGVELTEFEEINRIKYYKAVVSGANIWNKDVNLIINDGSWQTNDFETADWSGNKSEYYFNVVGKNIVQLSGRPTAINITIDGSFDDWAQINGNVTGPNSKYNTTTMKAYSDGTHMFIYTKVVTGAEGDHSGLGDGDIKFFFDKDNDATTGDTSTWYRIGADDVDNEFRVKLASESLRSVLADASYNASVKVTDDTTNRVMEMEIKFDLAALDYNKTTDCGTMVKIYSLGYCPKEFTGNVTVIY